MKTAQEQPEDQSIDLLGRKFSAVFGYDMNTQVPVGSHITLLPARYPYDSQRYYFGIKALVTGYRKVREWSQWQDHLLCERLEDRSDWMPIDNRLVWHPAFVVVDKVGTGRPTVAGVDYPMTAKDRFDALWRDMDHTHQTWSNPATFIAQLYLDTNQTHNRAVCGMVRADGTINPARLENYFRKSNLVIDDWAKLPAGFPDRLEYRYQVNWQEIAKSFEAGVREGKQFAAA